MRHKKNGTLTPTTSYKPKFGRELLVLGVLLPWMDGGPGGVFIATRDSSNGTQRCSSREPLVAMVEPADPWEGHDLSPVPPG